MSYRELVEGYFQALGGGDIESIVALCAPEIVLRNADQPPTEGVEGVRRSFLTFKDRTLERRFALLAFAAEKDVAFAWWHATWRFREGVMFGPFTTKCPFTVTLQGICRFKLNADGRVTELDIFHETSTILRLASEAAA